jgi:hypothetical protein
MYVLEGWLGVMIVYFVYGKYTIKKWGKELGGV